ENLDDWMLLASVRSTAIELWAAAQSVRDSLTNNGALFFGELVTRTGLLSSQVEEALSELAALGFVTCDSFDGLRALLVPSNKRPTFGRNEGKRRRKTNLASVEFAGRWSLIRKELTVESNGADSAQRDVAVEKFARVLLRRYGVMFRRLLERE